MTNFDVYFWDANRNPVAVAHTAYFADAVALAETLPHCDIVDSHTGEVLRTYECGIITYLV